MPVNYIIYDLEATCWLGRPPKGFNEIIEIGAVRINEYGEILGTFERFVKPTLNPKLSGFCKKLTSIKQNQIDIARTFPKVISDFKEWSGMYENDFHICSWGNNDRKLFLDECSIHKLDSDWVDHCYNLKNQYDNLNGGIVKGNLKKIVIKEGFEFTGIQHRAISDAENLAKIFLKYFDEWTFI
ncbi:MAG: exonuclease domain-containing protein [Saprospiraceae bacterium]|nr:exonuclease domain-containing protein [Bacteroidia bacterium]NNL90628.1 exonuclease domain-containing protein [Saprospiraceae bacterium]